MTSGTGTKVAGPAAIDPRIRQRRAEVARHRGRRRLRRIVVALVVAAIVAGAVALLHSPWASARVVTVRGVHPHTPTAAIVAAAGLIGHPPLVSVDPGASAARIEALPFVATATVQRRWPDGVVVTVTERVPTVQMAGPKGTWAILDGSGRTLLVHPGATPGLVQLVVRTAAGPLVPTGVGGSLPASATAGLAVARSLPPAFIAQVVSVTEAPDATVSLALDSGLTVLLGTDAGLGAKYEDVAAIIAHAALHGMHTIDVTVPQSPTVG